MLQNFEIAFVFALVSRTGESERKPKKLFEIERRESQKFRNFLMPVAT